MKGFLEIFFGAIVGLGNLDLFCYSVVVFGLGLGLDVGFLVEEVLLVNCFLILDVDGFN